jgi:hypothetical protein
MTVALAVAVDVVDLGWTPAGKPRVVGDNARPFLELLF